MCQWALHGALICTVLCLAGCAARPAGAWRLRPLERGHLLIPPLPPRTTNPELQVLVLKNARQPHGSAAACGVVSPEIRLDWRGRTAVVQVSSKALEPPQEVVLVGPHTLRGSVALDLRWFAAFQEKLKELEGNHRCMASGEAGLLAGHIVERLTVPSSLAYELRYGNYVMTGYLDLEPQFRLKTVAPFRTPGVKTVGRVEDMHGWETAWFELERRSDGGLRVRLRRAEVTIGGKVSRRAQASTATALSVPAEARYLRMFFRSWSVSQDRRLALLATPEPGQLDVATQRFEANPEGFCRAPEPAGTFCVTIPTDTALSAELKAQANGRIQTVPVRGSLWDLLKESGVQNPRSVLGSLKVKRPYEGTLAPVEFDRSRPDILGLILIGGEEVSW